MATRNKIGGFTERIEAVIRQRRGRLTLESLTDEGCAKIEQRIKELEQVTGGKPVQRRTNYADWSDDALLNAMLDTGTLDASDFSKGPKGRLS
jgi:hypothetical protein